MGNSVVLSLGHGHYAVYGHLQTGSVRVKAGQRVRAGQVLGRVGNTGPSGAPHLHFHVADGPLPLAAEGVPFVFKRFTLDGEVTNLDQVLAGAPADIKPVAGPKARRGQMPLQATTISFPG
jgi:murein DD-endopeptidase MepM/ murein hydrolase activator NlpD